MAPPTSIGPGEGQLNLIAWEGYTDTSWVKPFTAATGCKVNAKYAGSSDEMVTLMAGGGGGQWDMVSASGDADLRLIYGGDVKPMNPDLIPDFGDFQTYFKTPGYNTINGIHYGISLQWGPNVLLYNTQKFPIAPTSWSVLYDPANKGLITVPDNPIQIADAALYLMRQAAKPRHQGPVRAEAEISSTQRSRCSRPRGRWSRSTGRLPVMGSSSSPTATCRSAPPGLTRRSRSRPPRRLSPTPSRLRERQDGVTPGCSQPTRLHPNCAYLWTKYVSTPKVQAMQALFFGETPVNSKACAQMEALQAGSCKQYHADAVGSYFDTIKFWKTPIATCDDGSTNCIPYSTWQTSWTSVTSS